MDKQEPNTNKFFIYIKNVKDPAFESIKNTFKYVESENVRFFESSDGYYTILVDEVNTYIPGFLTMIYNTNDSENKREISLRLECIVAILKNIKPKLEMGFEKS